MTEIDTQRVLCRLSDLADSGCRGFAVGEGAWPLRGFVVQHANGAVSAFINWCPHQGHPLNLQPHRFLTPDRSAILCRSHGALFTRDQGLCIAGPCAGKSLRTLPIELLAGYVLLSQEANIAELAASVERS